MWLNLDGAAFHGASDATHAVLAMDDAAVVIRIAPSKEKAGER